MMTTPRSRAISAIRTACATALALCFALPAWAQLDLDQPEDALQAMRKLQCSTVDGKPAFYWWDGNVFSRVPGERDRLLFTYYGMNARTCVSVKHSEKGIGYRMVSREVLFYQDPQSGEILSKWENPWTGETNDVIHVANDPVNSRAPSFPMSARGPYQFGATFDKGRGWLTFEVPLFYENVLGGPYQDYVGGTYQAIEMFSFYFSEEEIKSANTTEATDAQVGWARMSQWLPWMKMGSRVGQLMFHGAGRRVDSYSDLPAVLRDEIDKNYPKFATPPPTDDTCPNETSWTYFKKIIDQRESGK